jgi:hypothetical protein
MLKVGAIPVHPIFDLDVARVMPNSGTARTTLLELSLSSCILCLRARDDFAVPVRALHDAKAKAMGMRPVVFILRARASNRVSLSSPHLTGPVHCELALLKIFTAVCGLPGAIRPRIPSLWLAQARRRHIVYFLPLLIGCDTVSLGGDSAHRTRPSRKRELGHMATHMRAGRVTVAAFAFIRRTITRFSFRQKQGQNGRAVWGGLR